MISLAEIKDYIKGFGLFEGYWIGRLSTKRQNTVGVYAMQSPPCTVPLGGRQFKRYDITPVQFLIHGNTSKSDTERLARELYNSLADRSEFFIGSTRVYFVKMLYACPVDVDSDGEVYEYTVQTEFITERN